MQIGKGFEFNVSRMVEPFVRHDLVTVVPYNQDAKSNHIENDAKNENSKQCVKNYGVNADWVSLMDTDEAFYFEKEGKALGVVEDLVT